MGMCVRRNMQASIQLTLVCYLCSGLIRTFSFKWCNCSLKSCWRELKYSGFSYVWPCQNFLDFYNPAFINGHVLLLLRMNNRTKRLDLLNVLILYFTMLLLLYKNEKPSLLYIRLPHWYLSRYKTFQDNVLILLTKGKQRFNGGSANV